MIIEGFVKEDFVIVEGCVWYGDGFVVDVEGVNVCFGF